jgi:hypothetical protein
MFSKHSSVIQLIKWAERGCGENSGRVFVEKSEGTRPLCVYKPIWKDTTKCITKKQDRMAWTGFIWLRIGQVAGFSVHSNKPLGLVKCGEFLISY